MYKSEQLAASLRNLIENGYWKENEKLPSLRQQVETSGFSLITVMNAYQELEAQGLIYSLEKKGYFIKEKNIKENHPNNIVMNDNIKINSTVFKYLKSIQSDNIIPFGSAFPDSQLLYSAKLMQMLGQKTKDQSTYQQTPSLPPGHFELRKQIAQRYSMQGIVTDPSDIVITSGGLDALNLSLQVLTQPGDYILLQETTFYGAWQAAEHLGLKVISIPDHPEGFDLEAFKNAIEIYPIKVCWLMLNSQNPIGYTVSDELKYEIAKILHEKEIYLIEDDVYEELYFDQKKPLSMKYFDQQNRVLHCSSFSKTLGAVFRVGWVYAGPFTEHIQHLQLMQTLSVNPLIQSTLSEYLSHRHYEKHLKNLRKNLKRLKLQYFQFFKDHLPENCTIKYFPSGYFLWIILPKNMNSHVIYNQLILKKISIAPSSLFTRNSLSNQIRVNCSFEISENIQYALDQLIQCVQMENDTLNAVQEQSIV